MDGTTTSTTTETNPAGAANLPTSSVLLPDDVLEKLYQSYALKQKRVAFGCYLAASMLFDLWAILVPQGQSWEAVGKSGDVG